MDIPLGSSGRKGERARARETRGGGEGEETPSPLACLLLARPFFLVPTTFKRLLRRLAWIWSRNFVWLSATKVTSITGILPRVVVPLCLFPQDLYSPPHSRIKSVS